MFQTTFLTLINYYMCCMFKILWKNCPRKEFDKVGAFSSFVLNTYKFDVQMCVGGWEGGWKIFFLTSWS